MKLTLFIIFWIIGIVIAFLGNKKLREWRCYRNPKSFLILGIFLTICMSWALIICLLANEDFEFPKK